MNLQVSCVLPPTTTALLFLKSLKLGEELEEFPVEVGRALKSLTLLDLSCNQFIRIPEAVIQITTLHTLNLSCNDELDLEGCDVSSMTSMPMLRSLSLAKSSVGGEWSQKSVAVLMAIMKGLPCLQMPGFGIIW